MLFKVLAIGRIKDPAIRSRCAEFAKWLGPYAKIEICELPDSDMAGEGAAFARALERDRGAALVVLSEEGKEFTSVDFARKLGSFDRKVVFVIGGPYGFSEAVYRAAQEKISLSRMTFSHQMVRLIFVEQVYRAMTILNNEPYHHA